jgi:hypothetical protein
MYPTHPNNAPLGHACRALGGDLTSLPALGSWLKSAVAGIIQERYVLLLPPSFCLADSPVAQRCHAAAPTCASVLHAA